MTERLNLYKLVVLGDVEAGKSALTTQFCLQEFAESYEPTVEERYRKRAQVDGTNCMLEIMDTSGREMYTRMIQMYILDQDGYMFVYDITSRTSFDRVRWFHAEVKREQARLHDTTSSPMCIIGNKLDMETERQVSSQEGFALAEELGCSFFETCSKDSASVEVPFHGMVKAIRKDHATGRGAPRMLERGRIYPHGPFLPRKRRPQSHKPSLFSRLARVFRSNKHG